MTSPASTQPPCEYFAKQECRSCPQIEVPYPQQVRAKTLAVRQLLPQVPEAAWLPTQQSAQFGFRNKAKMVVSGSAACPQLGFWTTLGGGRI